MDLNKVVNALGNSGAIGGFAGGVAGGALTGALMGKKGKKHAKTLLKAGGLAAVGGLAWKAYQSYQQGQQASAQQGSAQQASVSQGNALQSYAPQVGLPRSAQPAALPQQAQPAVPLAAPVAERDFAVDPSNAAQGSRGLLLVRAMIAAANSDGHLDFFGSNLNYWYLSLKKLEALQVI